MLIVVGCICGTIDGREDGCDILHPQWGLGSLDTSLGSTWWLWRLISVSPMSPFRRRSMEEGCDTTNLNR